MQDRQIWFQSLSQLADQAIYLERDSSSLSVALSGGLDSVVLTHALKTDCDRLAIKLQAIHVNHQISPHAEGWQRLCQQFCDQLNLPLITRTIRLKVKPRESLEMTARQQRYKAFLAELRPDSLLALAHHADDQIETCLLNALRGGGLAGFKAMLPLNNYQGLWLWRPLLTTAKQRLIDYACKHQLQWVEDESNQCLEIKRNRIRHQLLPSFDRIHPTSRKVLLHSITQAQQDWQSLYDLGCYYWQQQQTESVPLAVQSYQLQSWLSFQSATQQNLLKQLFNSYGLNLLHDYLHEICRQLQASQNVELLLGNQCQWLVHRRGQLLSFYNYQDCLAQLSTPPSLEVANYQWQPRQVGDYWLCNQQPRRIKSFMKKNHIPRHFRTSVLLLKRHNRVVAIHYPGLQLPLE